MLQSEHILNTPSVVEVLGDRSQLGSHYEISTDTRQFQQGQCFLAIKGQKFDGFQFIDKVIDKTDLIILEATKENNIKAKDLSLKFPDKVFVLTKNSIVYTQELASAHVKEWLQKKGREIIAISGSNGKTTTKEMLWHLLKSINPNNVIRTEKNNNNHLGVPFTVFQISEETDFAIVEYGSNHPGEMKVICDCSHPTMGITTNIGDTHMEFFKNRDEVFQEESLVYKYIKESQFGKKLFLLNLDDEHLSKLEINPTVKTFSFNKPSDYQYSFLREKNLIQVNGLNLKNDKLMGQHNFLNLANAYVLALDLYPDKKDELVAACEKFEPTENRSQWVNWQGAKVFLDAYNANPSSMRLAASEFYETFRGQEAGETRCLLVVGDMNELGDRAPEYHRELGEYLSTLDRADVVYFGRFHKEFQSGYKGKLLISKEDISLNPKELEVIKEHSWVFVKASRSLQLESVLDIKERTT